MHLHLPKDTPLSKLIAAVAGIAVVFFVVVILIIKMSATSGIVAEEVPTVYSSMALLDDSLKIERQVYNASQMKVRLGRVVFNRHLRLKVKNANIFTVSFFNNEEFVASQKIHDKGNDIQVKEYGYLLQVPAPAVEEGYDSIMITPHFEFGVKLSLEDKKDVKVSMGQQEIHMAEAVRRTPEDHYVLIAVKDEGSGAFRTAARKAFDEMGSKMSKLKYRGSYVGVFKHGKMLGEKIDNSKAVKIEGDEIPGMRDELAKRGMKLSIKSAGYTSGNMAVINVNGIDHSTNKRGHNYVILDKNLKFVKSFNVDTFATDKLKHYDIYDLHVEQLEEVTISKLMQEMESDFTVLLSTKGSYVANLSENTSKYFDQMGSSLAKAKRGESYAAIIRNGKVAAEKLGKGIQTLSGFDAPQLKDDLLEIGKQITVVSNSRSGKGSSFIVNGQEIDLVAHGIQLLVLDKRYQILNRYKFDLTDGELIDKVTVLKSKPEDRPKHVAAEDKLFASKLMRIEIAPEAYQRLFAMRSRALNIRATQNASKEEVPATIEWQGKKYKANIRFKGDWVDHIEFNQWSFRVRLKGENSIMGMKRFAVQRPDSRQRLYEWVVHQVYRDEGGITPRYDFVAVDVNNKRLGTYAVEEHFGKRMIEYHKRKEGPILKLNESRPFKSSGIFERLLPRGIYLNNYWASLERTDIDVFQEGKTLASKTLRDNFERAYALLDGFRMKKIQPHEAFDVNAYGRLLAVSDLFQTWHSTRWHNIRFYYNPIDDRLEPILYDADNPDKNHLSLAIQDFKDELSQYMFEDKELLRSYFRWLEKFSDEEYIPTFRKKYKDYIRDSEKLLRANHANVAVPWYMFQGRQQQMRRTLYHGNPLDGVIERIRDGELTISISNDYRIPYEIGNVKVGGREFKNINSGSFIGRSNKNTKFKFAIEESKRESVKADIKNAKPVFVQFKLPGVKDWRELQVFTFSRSPAEFDAEDFIRDRSNIEEFSFLEQDEQRKQIRFKQGTWPIRKDIKIPSGYRLVINQGTELQLLQGSKIISFSPIDVLGTRDYPIVISSPDDSSQGLVVLRANESVHTGSTPSKLLFVTFSGLKNPDKQGWFLPGSVSFYKSDVNIYHSTFKNNHSEDALNIISSKYEIRDSTFEKTFADAFDSDFSDGVISKSFFRDTGNDAIDFSGSNVEVYDVEIVRAGDKGVSAGEQSNIKLKNITINGAEIGIASKDNSVVKGDSVSIKQAVIGLAGYQKKPEYGPSFLELNNSFVNPNLSLRYINDNRSQIRLNGESVFVEKKKKRLLIRDIAT